MSAASGFSSERGAVAAAVALHETKFRFSNFSDPSNISSTRISRNPLQRSHIGREPHPGLPYGEDAVRGRVSHVAGRKELEARADVGLVGHADHVHAALVHGRAGVLHGTAIKLRILQRTRE